MVFSRRLKRKAARQAATELKAVGRLRVGNFLVVKYSTDLIRVRAASGCWDETFTPTMPFYVFLDEVLAYEGENKEEVLKEVEGRIIMHYIQSTNVFDIKFHEDWVRAYKRFCKRMEALQKKQSEGERAKRDAEALEDVKAVENLKENLNV